MQNTQNLNYVGRFAPTPSGHLHAGSLSTALGSFLEAKSRGGRWLLRIDDLDPPRVAKGAIDSILRTLEALGLFWDGEICWQSRRFAAYEDAVLTLKNKGLAYVCQCSRKLAQTQGTALANGQWRYAGTCRNQNLSAGKQRAWRFIAPDRNIEFIDAIQGKLADNLAQSSGDFIIWRADGIFAYHLATVLDDAFMGVTHVMRGADLWTMSLPQIALQEALDLPQPHYAHLPIMQSPDGLKLGKQTRAPAISTTNPLKTLTYGMELLGFCPPELANVNEFWAWALEVWQLDKIQAAPKIITTPI